MEFAPDADRQKLCTDFALIVHSGFIVYREISLTATHRRETPGAQLVSFVLQDSAFFGGHEVADSTIGETREWRLDNPNSFDHLTFGLFSWFTEVGESFVPQLFQPWFKSIGAIVDAMGSDGIEDHLVEVLS